MLSDFFGHSPKIRAFDWLVDYVEIPVSFFLYLLGQSLYPVLFTSLHCFVYFQFPNQTVVALLLLTWINLNKVLNWIMAAANDKRFGDANNIEISEKLITYIQRAHRKQMLKILDWKDSTDLIRDPEFRKSILELVFRN